MTGRGGRDIIWDMSETPPARTGRFGAIFVILVIAGSAVGVLTWHLGANRGAGSVDTTGFDLDTAPDSVRAPAAASRRPDAAPRSSLGSFKSDAGIRVADGNASARRSGPSPAAEAQLQKQESRESLAKAARKHESAVRRFAQRMTARYPVVRQYGKDWMGHPDLKKLNDDYMRDKDPVKFLLGLSRSENFGKMMTKYAGAPEIREFALGAVKQSPLELKTAAMDVLGSDRVVKDLVMNVAKAVGLPASVIGTIEGGAPAKTESSKIDQNKAVTEMMGDPEMKKVMQQGAPPPAVSVGQ